MSADSEQLKYPPGGMVDDTSMGGRKTLGNVTISRFCDWGRDWPKTATWMALAGSARGTIGQQAMDIFKNPQGKPLVYSGTLKAVTPPEPDSTGSDEARVEMEFRDRHCVVMPEQVTLHGPEPPTREMEAVPTTPEPTPGSIVARLRSRPVHRPRSSARTSRWAVSSRACTSGTAR